MHTDEYEISLAREITVCKNIIARITSELNRLEQKHNLSTTDFVTAAHGKSSPDNPDHHHWLQEYETLLTWQQRLREYEEALRSMRI